MSAKFTMPDLGLRIIKALRTDKEICDNFEQHGFLSAPCPNCETKNLRDKDDGSDCACSLCGWEGKKPEKVVI